MLVYDILRKNALTNLKNLKMILFAEKPLRGCRKLYAEAFPFETSDSRNNSYTERGDEGAV